MLRHLLCAPGLLALAVTGPDAPLRRDLERWIYFQGSGEDAGPRAFLDRFARFPEFRTLTYYRLRRSGTAGRLVAIALNRVYKGERTLHLVCPKIGPGLYLLHGYATIIDAEEIGHDCFIGHGVTIGHNEQSGRPTLGNGVIVYANSTIIGPIHVGNGVKVATMSLVNRDVPPATLVAGIPAKPIGDHVAPRQGPA